VHSKYTEAQDYLFSDMELVQIQKLADEKYETWDWNFGASPKYNLSRAIRTAAGTIEAYLDIQQGKIETIRIFGDFFSARPISELEAALQGLPHEETALRAKLAELPLSEYFGAVSPDDLIGLLM
jgi:lipoate-protein ligase A